MRLSIIGCLLIAFSQFLTAQTSTFDGFRVNSKEDKITLLRPASYVQTAPEYQATNVANAPLFSRKRAPLTLPLHAGTPIYLRTIEIINFDELTAGQPIKFMVSKDVVADGTILIRSNVVATGVITSKKAPTVSTPASVIIEVTGVNAVDGQAITLTSQDQRFSGKYPGQSFEIPMNKSVVAYVTNNQMIEVAEE